MQYQVISLIPQIKSMPPGKWPIEHSELKCTYFEIVLLRTGSYGEIERRPAGKWPAQSYPRNTLQALQPGSSNPRIKIAQGDLDGIIRRFEQMRTGGYSIPVLDSPKEVSDSTLGYIAELRRGDDCIIGVAQLLGQRQSIIGLGVRATLDSTQRMQGVSPGMVVRNVIIVSTGGPINLSAASEEPRNPYQSTIEALAR
ncbi:MAG: hypothetical protein H7144_04940 [Burkholderiales bacterium]|nr:hypothetical protein [Phycisphaerae bacterium]